MGPFQRAIKCFQSSEDTWKCLEDRAQNGEMLERNDCTLYGHFGLDVMGVYVGQIEKLNRQLSLEIR